jgi:hypothetical protein
MDYADYAARFSLSHFRTILQDPTITRQTLAALLRRSKCMLTEEGKAECWPVFMANYIEQNANSNMNG